MSVPRHEPLPDDYTIFWLHFIAMIRTHRPASFIRDLRQRFYRKDRLKKWKRYMGLACAGIVLNAGAFLGPFLLGRRVDWSQLLTARIMVFLVLSLFLSVLIPGILLILLSTLKYRKAKSYRASFR